MDVNVACGCYQVLRVVSWRVRTSCVEQSKFKKASGNVAASHAPWPVKHFVVGVCCYILLLLSLVYWDDDDKIKMNVDLYGIAPHKCSKH